MERRETALPGLHSPVSSQLCSCSVPAQLEGPCPSSLLGVAGPAFFDLQTVLSGRAVVQRAEGCGSPVLAGLWPADCRRKLMFSIDFWG